MAVISLTDINVAQAKKSRNRGRTKRINHN